MTELERFAAVLLAQWHNEAGRATAALGVADLLDRVLPYRAARRALAIESSEEYEALVLRMIAEESGLVTTDPLEFAEMARTTLETKIPDLDVLRLLRSATITFTDDAISRLDGVRPLPPATADQQPAQAGPGADVLPMRRAPEVADHTATATATPAPRDTAPPPPFLTRVAFTAPGTTCWQCSAPLPQDRAVKFCVECGADQRKPRCGACGSDVEPGWKHCAECGAPVSS